jgi:phosphocarrier protein NPr
MIKKKIQIINKLGLHARAAAKFVSTASKFQSHIDVLKDNQSVNGKSIMGIMMLAASKGTELEISIDGQDEEQALTALIDLINNLFGESE